MQPMQWLLWLSVLQMRLASMHYYVSQRGRVSAYFLSRSLRHLRQDGAKPKTRHMRPPRLQIQHCVSLGPTCNAAEYLRCHPAGLRRYALPFDWIHSDAALIHA